MSRTGVEAKPAWKCVPQAVRRRVDAALGAPVIRATRIWGGYAPTPTYRLVLADGRRAFFKGIFQDSNEFMKNALLFEERVYRELDTILGRWMPQLYATFRHDDWHVLILEDLGPKSVPLWTLGKTRAITHALAEFHRSSLGSQPPVWLPRPEEELVQENWARTAQASLEVQKIAALAGAQSPQALEWFQKISPKIKALMQQSALREGAYAILHPDL